MANEDLNAGFTGTPTEQPEGVRNIAKTATDVVKRETSAVAAGVASEHRNQCRSGRRNACIRNGLLDGQKLGFDQLPLLEVVARHSRAALSTEKGE